MTQPDPCLADTPRACGRADSRERATGRTTALDGCCRINRRRGRIPRCRHRQGPGPGPVLVEEELLRRGSAATPYPLGGGWPTELTEWSWTRSTEAGKQWRRGELGATGGRPATTTCGRGRRSPVAARTRRRGGRRRGPREREK